MNTMNKTNTPYLNDDRASIGIGAMIVFIALILVSSVVLFFNLSIMLLTSCGSTERKYNEFCTELVRKAP